MIGWLRRWLRGSVSVMAAHGCKHCYHSDLNPVEGCQQGGTDLVWRCCKCGYWKPWDC